MKIGKYLVEKEGDGYGKIRAAVASLVTAYNANASNVEEAIDDVGELEGKIGKQFYKAEKMYYSTVKEFEKISKMAR